MKTLIKSTLVLALVSTLLINGLLLTSGQDIPPNEDLSLGASVFVFRSTKTAQKKFAATSSAKVRRSKTQRVASATRIRKQYDNLAKVTTRRKAVKTVTPAEALRKNPPGEKPQVTSAKFTGVGQYYYAQSNWSEAERFFREAISLDAKNQNAKLGLSDALTSKATVLFAEDKKDEAKKLYDEALKLNDKNSAAYAGLGEYYDSLDDKSETNVAAINNFEKALALDKDLTEIYSPLGVLYYQQGDFVKSDDYLSKALTIDQEDSTTQYLIGLIRLKQDRYDESAAAFEKSIALMKTANLENETADAHYYLGASYDKLNRGDDAIAQYKEATRLNPKYAEAWNDLGVTYYNRGEYDNALTAYTQSVKYQNTGLAHANIADTYRELKKYPEANGEYALAAFFIKNDAELYSNWGFCLGKVQRWDIAINRLSQAVALSPDALDYTNMGWAYYNAAQLDLQAKNKASADTNLKQGKTALQKATALNQNLAPAFINLGITLNDLGEYQSAKEALLRATSLRKNWLFAINELGLSYRKLGELDNAVEQFRRTVEINDKYDIGYYNLGEAELRRGNVKEAKKAMEKLKKLNRNMGNALEILILGMDKSLIPGKVPGKNKIKSILKY